MSRKCLFPFSNIVLNPSGSVSPCCKYNLNKVDTEIDIETLHDKNIKELFYQPAMEKIRNDFLNDILKFAELALSKLNELLKQDASNLYYSELIIQF